jgi:hypothetical protein
MALGLGGCALMLFALGFCGGLRSSVIWGLTIAGAIGAFLRFGCDGKARLTKLAIRRDWLDWPADAATEKAGEGSGEGPGKWPGGWPGESMDLAMFLAVMAYGAMILVLTQYPPLQWDAIGNHLVLAREYLTTHRVVAHPGLAQPVLPALNHMLFTWGLALADDALAQMVEYTFLMLTALGLVAWGRRQGRAGFGVACAAFWLSHPLVVWLGVSAYVDVCATCYALLGVYALRVFWDARAPDGQVRPDGSRRAEWWLSGMALLGMAAAAKMNALLFPTLGAGLGLWAWARSRLGWRQFAYGLGLCSFVAVPWYAFITYNTGNPIWPMPFPFQIVSPQLKLPAYQAAGAIGVGLPISGLNFLRLPALLVADPRRFAADDLRGLSVLIAVWPLAWVFAIWNRSVRWWTLWGLAYTAFWFVTAQFVRYWTPALPLVGLALFESIQWVNDRVWKSVARRRLVWALLTLGAISSSLWSLRVEIGSKWIRMLTPAEEREAFLTRHCNGYSGVAYVNARERPGETIYLVNGNYLSYYCRPRVIGFVNVLEFTPGTSMILWPGTGRRGLPGDQNGKPPNWLLMVNYGAQLSPAPGPLQGGVRYQLVYADRQSYVFRLAPAVPGAGELPRP